MSKGYCTIQDVENYLLITVDPSFYDQVDEWIGEVEEYIDRKTGRNFVVEIDESGDGEARKFDGSGCSKLVIDDCLEVNKVEIGVTELEEVDPLDYVLKPSNSTPKTLIQLRNAIFLRDLENVTVTGFWGYSVTAPGDIKFAATVLVAGIINNAWLSEGEVQSESIGRYSVTYKTKDQIDDFAEVEDILKSRKKYNF